MDTNKTIVYYTSNCENPKFEQVIMDNLVKNSGGLPIISVSRKPIKLGKNICVGEVPVCYTNSFKQLLIGLKAAKTKYCIAAEADTLYPPKYFEFTPKTKNVYRYTNLYVYFVGHEGMWKKRCVEAAQMCDREHWIKSIEKVTTMTWEPEPFQFVFDTKDQYSWTSDQPVLYFKTHKGINYKTGFINGRQTEIPYWGSLKDIKKLFKEVV